MVNVTVRACRLGRPKPRFPLAQAIRWAHAMLRELKVEGELSIVLTDDATMRTLNRTHRRKDRPTDVLAFSLREGRRPPAALHNVLGDVVISLDTAAVQAKEHRRTLAHEVALLLAHGLLHLLGHDHRTQAEERAMKREETKLLRAVTGASNDVRAQSPRQTRNTVKDARAVQRKR